LSLTIYLCVVNLKEGGGLYTNPHCAMVCRLVCFPEVFAQFAQIPEDRL